MAAGKANLEALSALADQVLLLSLHVDGAAGFYPGQPEQFHEWASNLRATYVELMESADVPPGVLDEIAQELSDSHQKILTNPSVAHSVHLEGEIEDRLRYVVNDLTEKLLPRVARSIERAFNWTIATFTDPPEILPDDCLSVVHVAAEANPSTMSVTFELYDFAERSGDGRLSLPDRQNVWLPHLLAELAPVCEIVRLADILFEHDQDPRQAACEWPGYFHRLVISFQLEPDVSN